MPAIVWDISSKGLLFLLRHTKDMMCYSLLAKTKNSEFSSHKYIDPIQLATMTTYFIVIKKKGKVWHSNKDREGNTVLFKYFRSVQLAHLWQVFIKVVIG